jgi:hypothetical protein
VRHTNDTDDIIARGKALDQEAQASRNALQKRAVQERLSRLEADYDANKDADSALLDNAYSDDFLKTPPVTATAKQLATAYETDHAAARQAYGLRRVRLSGRFASFYEGFGEEQVWLDGLFPGEEVRAVLEPSQGNIGIARNLKAGQQVRLWCAGVTTDALAPVLHHCEFSEPDWQKGGGLEKPSSLMEAAG